MVSPNRLARLLAVPVGLAGLLVAPATAGANPVEPTAVPFEVRYNPGDQEPASGPNSFLMTAQQCPPTYYVEYRWGTKSGRINAKCGGTAATSLAPLGGTEHALQWRSCMFMMWKKPPLPYVRCDDYHDDVVLTD